MICAILPPVKVNILIKGMLIRPLHSAEWIMTRSREAKTGEEST